MKELNIATRRGSVLYGVLFDGSGEDAIQGEQQIKIDLENEDG